MRNSTSSRLRKSQSRWSLPLLRRSHEVSISMWRGKRSQDWWSTTWCWRTSNLTQEGRWSANSTATSPALSDPMAQASPISSKACSSSLASMPAGWGWTNSTNLFTTPAHRQATPGQQLRFTSKNWFSSPMENLLKSRALSFGSEEQSILRAFPSIFCKDMRALKPRSRKDWMPKESTWETTDFWFFKEKWSKSLKWSKNQEIGTSQDCLSIFKISLDRPSILSASSNAGENTRRPRSKSTKRVNWWRLSKMSWEGWARQRTKQFAM